MLALIHTANRDYKSLIEDLVALDVLPADTDRGQVEPVMKRVIGPYVFEGGGAKSLNYQSLARDLARATLEIPFNIPPYFALIARALGILEGVALTGDPDYRIVMEAYPFVTRKIISDDSPALQRALRDILYSEDGKFLAKRLSVLLSYATGVVAADSAVFVDFDTLPSTAASLSQTLQFLLAEEARPLRAALVGEASNAADLVLRRGTRQAVVRAKDLLRPPPPPLPFLPRLPSLPFPVPESVVDALSPKLTVEEDIFLASLEELAYALAGIEQGTVSDDPLATIRQLLQAGSDGSGGAGELVEFVRTLPGDSEKTEAIFDVGSEVVQNLADRASERFNGLLSGGSGGGSGRDAGR
ncbi:Predicted unusual protein kinase (ISS) [Ectocarpus siliculosus]|uniref:Predicted unusual protein kinase (ISS) n=1 Tax=Ectocarpus siliculosus TaxID=2880 RepID=D8LT20_ECTSI|nr:Predicted unusual protein kinase (ISS) [Ectocarpus siliculosus]|eukprot:CBN75294.1 Predicted unusual protein kinase (ISS) [Ectocarpus siliculosus]